MAFVPSRLRRALGASSLALLVFSAPAGAESIFTAPSDGFVGSVRGGSSAQGQPLYKGGKATISGSRLTPGQQITLMRGVTILNPEAPLVVDAEGNFSHEIQIDDEAATGLQPILVIGENPAAAEVIELKISPEVPLSGVEKFDIASAPATRGLYQVAFSPKSGAVYVAAAVGRPPVRQSALLKVDAETLETLATATPPVAPAPPPRPGAGGPGGAGPGAGGPGGPGGAPQDDRPPLFAVYGVGVDDANGRVWVTNTRQNTLAVYDQADLSLVKQFDPGLATHSRDVVVDEANGRAYVSTSFENHIVVIDTATLEILEPVVIQSGKRGETFGTMSLDLDPVGGKLVTVSMGTNEAAVVDVRTGEAKVIPLPGARGASGAAYDPQEGLIFVASQQSDNLLIVKAETGEVLHDVKVGAQPLNVAFEPVERLAYVANRGAGTITVVNTSGEIVANLDAGNLPNQLRADGKGNVWAVNKARGEDDPTGDRVWRIRPKAQ
ncbi:YncE family protein [Neomegalonema sp.]|uniref:Vgb family protein n=1 Tax=Neomegalonema sp. TaxID=2039713 RepID=UPI002619877D|nr:YncE family protein [Neomegalonema sp.]MDD2868407.1 YncE family protein [Neomegalonema sp.]